MTEALPSSTPSLIAFGIAAAALCLGIYFGWTHDPIDLNRSGAVIAIAGIYLTYSKYLVRAEQQLETYVTERFDDAMSKVLDSWENEGKPIDNFLFERRLRTNVRNKLHSGVRSRIVALRSSFQRVEIGLIAVGTILSGFGDLIVCTLKRAVA